MGSFSSQRRGIRYFAFLLKLNDRHFVGFLAFIWPVVQWITWQWSLAPILSPWNARFSLLLVLGKYSYAISQQPSWHVPPYFRQISHASPLLMCENLSERGHLDLYCLHCAQGLIVKWFFFFFSVTTHVNIIYATKQRRKVHPTKDENQSMWCSNSNECRHSLTTNKSHQFTM